MTPQQSTELLQATVLVMLFINIAKKYEEIINVMESGLMFFILLLLHISSSSNSMCYIIKLLLLILLLSICYALISYKIIFI